MQGVSGAKLWEVCVLSVSGIQSVLLLVTRIWRVSVNEMCGVCLLSEWNVGSVPIVCEWNVGNVCSVCKWNMESVCECYVGSVCTV